MVVTALCILLIGASRIYLGVHYFSDVAAGLLAGTLWLAICVTTYQFVAFRRRPRSY